MFLILEVVSRRAQSTLTSQASRHEPQLHLQISQQRGAVLENDWASFGPGVAGACFAQWVGLCQQPGLKV